MEAIKVVVRVRPNEDPQRCVLVTGPKTLVVTPPGASSEVNEGPASGSKREPECFEFDRVIDDVIDGNPSAKKDGRKDTTDVKAAAVNKTYDDDDELFKLSQFLTKRGASLDATPEQPPQRPSLPGMPPLGASQLKSVYKPPVQDGKSPIYCPNTVDKRFDEFVEDLL